MGDFIEDKEVENPATQTAYTLLQEQLREVLSTLPPREQEVLKMRFGLDDGYSLTLEEVGLYFNVTRERIRQIEAKALRPPASAPCERTSGLYRNLMFYRQKSYFTI